MQNCLCPIIMSADSCRRIVQFVTKFGHYSEILVNLDKNICLFFSKYRFIQVKIRTFNCIVIHFRLKYRPNPSKKSTYMRQYMDFKLKNGFLFVKNSEHFGKKIDLYQIEIWPNLDIVKNWPFLLKKYVNSGQKLVQIWTLIWNIER